MSASNADLVREALAVHRRDGFAALAQFADPRIEVRMGDGINAGEYLGPDEAVRFNAEWEDAWAETAYEVAEIEEIDDRNLIVRIEMAMLGEGSGVEVSGTQWWLFEVSDGGFVRWHLYADRESALTAVDER